MSGDSGQKVISFTNFREDLLLEDNLDEYIDVTTLRKLRNALQEL